MRLKELPKTFGLSELKKGFFPHWFNKPCHQSYIGNIPSRKRYSPETMSSNERGAFLKWHQKKG